MRWAEASMRTQKAPLCSSAASLNGPSVCPQHKPLLVPLTTLLTLAQTLGRKRLVSTDPYAQWSVHLRKCESTQKGRTLVMCVFCTWYLCLQFQDFNEEICTDSSGKWGIELKIRFLVSVRFHFCPSVTLVQHFNHPLEHLDEQLGRR